MSLDVVEDGVFLCVSCSWLIFGQDGEAVGWPPGLY